MRGRAGACVFVSAIGRRCRHPCKACCPTWGLRGTAALSRRAEALLFLSQAVRLRTIEANAAYGTLVHLSCSGMTSKVATELHGSPEAFRRACRAARTFQESG